MKADNCIFGKTEIKQTEKTNMKSLTLKVKVERNNGKLKIKQFQIEKQRVETPSAPLERDPWARGTGKNSCVKIGKGTGPNNVIEDSVRLLGPVAF